MSWFGLNTFIAREWFSEESLLLVNALYKKVKAAYLKTYFLSLLVEHPYQTSRQREAAAEYMLKQLGSIKAHPSYSSTSPISALRSIGLNHVGALLG